MPPSNHLDIPATGVLKCERGTMTPLEACGRLDLVIAPVTLVPISRPVGLVQIAPSIARLERDGAAWIDILRVSDAYEPDRRLPLIVIRSTADEQWLAHEVSQLSHGKRWERGETRRMICRDGTLYMRADSVLIALRQLRRSEASSGLGHRARYFAFKADWIWSITAWSSMITPEIEAPLQGRALSQRRRGRARTPLFAALTTVAPHWVLQRVCGLLGAV